MNEVLTEGCANKSLNKNIEWQEDCASLKMMKSESLKEATLKRQNSEAVSRHHHFLKQRKMTSYCNAAFVPSLASPPSSSLSGSVSSVKELHGAETPSVGRMVEEGGVEELRSVVCELEEVAVTMVYSDGSSQLRRSPTSVCDEIQYLWKHSGEYLVSWALFVAIFVVLFLFFFFFLFCF